MKADTADLATIFGKPVHYLVPLYQRPYVWTRENQWAPLWEDVREVANRQLDGTPSNDEIPHFLGAIVLEPALISSVKIGALSIIDGQQRLTTLQLLIAAARSVAAEHAVDDVRLSFEKLLFNDAFLVKRPGDELKVFPTQRDRPAFREALSDGVVASSGSHRMHEAYRFFRSAIKEWAEVGADAEETARRLEGISTAIWNRVRLVTIDLEPGDNAQIIFETLNARGTPLLAGDLVKNHLFQSATVQGADVDDLYQRYWQALDTDWWREEVQRGRLRQPRLDIFLTYWLAMSTGREVVSHQLFPEFKRYLADGGRAAADVLADLARYGAVFEGFENEPGTTPLGRFLYRLDAMEVTTAFPALLWMLGPDGFASADERQAALGAIESWLVRRMLTRQTTQNYNTIFLALLKRVREEAAARSGPPSGAVVVDFLAGLTGQSGYWPTAGEVRSALQTLPAYTVFSRGRLRMLLEALERAMYTGFEERVQIEGNLTIEHVLPQEWSSHWPLPETTDPFQAKLDRDAAKHRLGNLTLLTQRLNSSESNGGWELKRAALRKDSVLRMSADLREAAAWDEAAIAERGDRMAGLAIAIWPRPDDSEQAVAPEAVAVRAGDARPAGSPDPDNPDAFAAVLAIADETGVGEELRRVIAASRELGLWPRPDRYSVMVAPPADHRFYLFTLWPQWDEGGSFKIWKSSEAFARWLPGVTLEAARSEMGASEEAGVLLREDTDAFLAALRRLVPSQDDDAFEERKAALLASGITGVEGVPGSVLRLIDHRAGGSPEIALRFAAAVLVCDGVALRPQQSKWDPWYFQVRHPKFRQVVAYAHPKPGEIRVEFRLSATHDTYGVATARDNFYGIVLTATDEASLATALRLLEDALARDE